MTHELQKTKLPIDKGNHSGNDSERKKERHYLRLKIKTKPIS